MKRKVTPKIGNFLNNQSFAHLEHKITQLKRINQSLQAILPLEFKGKCEVANLNEQQLIIGVNIQALATRLNMMAPDLLEKLRQQGYGYISTIKVIVLSDKTGYEKDYWETEAPNKTVLEQLKKTIKGD